jgi:site-specific DNA-methyltransferase (adenine-specific)/modification methylase
MIINKYFIQAGDSKELIKTIPSNSIDLILTDPPYNLGNYSTGNIELNWRKDINNDLAEWDTIDFKPEEWVFEFKRILKPSGNIFAFTSYNLLGKWHEAFDHEFDTFQFMVWHKTNPAPKIFKAGFLNSCELIICCWNKGHIWNFLSQKEMHNFIESPICMGIERLKEPNHPTQKPIKVLKRIIEISSNPEQVVFDPFMGVGSTGVAALQMDRKFIGFELESIYFEAAKKRIEIESMQTSLFTFNK